MSLPSRSEVDRANATARQRARRAGEPRWKVSRHDWDQDAACRGVPAEDISRVFFPAHGPGRGARNNIYVEARTYCNRCVVRDDCLQAAMLEEHGVGRREGVRGGLSPSDRQRLAAGRPVEGVA